MDGTEYEYADFHILTTDGTDVCAARGTYLPTSEGDNQGLFCSQTDTELRAIFNWNNGNRNSPLSWLVDVEQIGSRTKAGVACGVDGETVPAGRCANQLSGGKRAFESMAGSGGAGIRDLNTSNLDSFEKMFARAREFDQNLSGWNTANVTTIAYMFQDAEKFTNGGDSDINNWDTGKVTEMNDAFTRAVLFNHDLSGWDTSEVTTMYAMFYGASSFNGSVSSWNTSKVSKMKSMFKSAVAFNRDLSHFDVGLVTDMSSMFSGAKVFNQDISAWTTGNVSDMTSMFESAKAFNRDLSAWNVTRIARQPSRFFSSATGWTGIDPDTNEPWCNQGEPRWGTDGTGLCLTECSDESIDWSTAATEPGWSCAVDGTAYEYADFHVLNTTNPPTTVCGAEPGERPGLPTGTDILFCKRTGTSIKAIFDWDNRQRYPYPNGDLSPGSGAVQLLDWLQIVEQFGSRSPSDGDCGEDIKPTVGGRCPNQLKAGRSAFYSMKGGGNATAAFENLDVSNLTNMEKMFFNAGKFDQDIGGWDTSNVTNMFQMFDGARAFNQDIGGWDYRKRDEHGITCSTCSTRLQSGPVRMEACPCRRRKQPAGV